MMRYLIVSLVLLASPLQAKCRQALALGLDVSKSVDATEYRLQLDGLAQALLHPEITETLLAMPGAPVRLAVFEWSEPGFQRLLLDWQNIDRPEDIDRITQTLRSTQRTNAPPGTAVGSAMIYGTKLLSRQPGCWQKTLDLSGDGKHNLGPDPRDVKQSVSGVTINGLVIGADITDITDLRQMEIGELSAYYGAWVITGPGAFVETALGYESYQAAMLRKLKRELKGLSLSSLSPEAKTSPGTRHQTDQ